MKAFLSNIHKREIRQGPDQGGGAGGAGMLTRKEEREDGSFKWEGQGVTQEKKRLVKQRPIKRGRSRHSEKKRTLSTGRPRGGEKTVNWTGNWC